MKAEDILNLYDWGLGACFHCARTAVDTTVVTVLHPVSSPPQPVRACRICLLVLEEERRVAAERRGRHYEPGRIGDGEQGTSRAG